MAEKLPVNEREFIQHLASKFRLHHPDIPLSLGDDAAALVVEKNQTLLLTTDTLVSGVHFLDIASDYQKIGQKSILVNLSDIAAMGGIPRYFLMSLALPSKINFKKVDDLLTGMALEANSNQLILLGGDCVGSKVLTITITMLGEAKDNKFITRRGMRVGEGIFSGEVGGSAGGLKFLKKKRESLTASQLALIERHLLPPNRVKLSQFLLANFPLSSMLDLSDGLFEGLKEFSLLNKVGFLIDWEKIILPKVLLENFKRQSMMEKLCLFGGEDYELLFTAPLPLAEDITSQAFKEFSVKIQLIGEVKEESFGIKLKRGNRIKELTGSGFEHFHFR